MMAGAKCFIMSRSGFSSVAEWWGGIQCTTNIYK